MKTLYESILDDEDELIGRAKDAFNDPFTAVIAAIDSGMSRDDLQKFISGGVFDEFIKNELYLDPKNHYWIVNTYTDSIASASLCNKDIEIYPFIIRYRRNSKIFDVELAKFNARGEVSKIFEYDKYKKTLSHIRKRGFKKSNSSLDKIGNYNVYNKKI